MILYVLLLAIVPAAVEAVEPVTASAALLVDEAIEVPASGWRSVVLQQKQQPAVLDCRFEVKEGGSGVRVSLMSRANAERFERGQSHQPQAATPFQRSGSLRAVIDTPDEYFVVVDNRLEGRGPARVHLRVALVFHDAIGKTQPVRELPAGRRAVVVALSLAFFFAVAVYSARRLLPFGPR